MIINFKKIWEKIDLFFIRNWKIFYIIMFVFLSFQLGKELYLFIFYNEARTIHTQIFFMSFIYFILLLFLDPKPLLFIIPFFLLNWIDVYSIGQKFANFIFYKTILKNIFLNLPAKDINVLFIISFLILSIFFLILYIWKKKKKYIFSLITIFIYVITTFIFNYFYVEIGYHQILNLEISHMKKVLHENKDTKNFFIICKNQNYVCAISKAQLDKIIIQPAFKNWINKLPNKEIIGNYSYKKDVILIVEKNQIWVIQPDIGTIAFQNAKNNLMLSLDIAHGIWLLFFIWLNLFHYRYFFQIQKIEEKKDKMKID